MSQLKRLLGLLNDFDELDLAWLYGKNYHDHKESLKKEHSQIRLATRFGVGLVKIFTMMGMRRTRMPVKGVVFFSASNNQGDSLIHIHKSLLDSGATSVFLVSNRKLYNRYRHVKKVRRLKSNIFDCFLAWGLAGLRIKRLTQMIYNRGMLDKRVISNFDTYFLCYQYLSVFVATFIIGKPRLVIMSNDHNSENRTIVLACRKSDVEVGYVQHASPSIIFPPLKQFDYAFLDGDMSLNIYESIKYDERQLLGGSFCNIYLTGIQKKSTQGLDLVSCNRKYRVGIATSGLDSIDKLKGLLRSLEGYRVLIRPHPQQDSDFIVGLKVLAKQYSNISLSLSGTLQEYLNCIQLNLACESSVHIEALLNDMQSYYIDLAVDDFNFDYYGFLASGIISVFSTDVLKCDEVSRLSDSQLRLVKKYSSSFGTDWENREHDHVAKLIQKIINSE